MTHTCMLCSRVVLTEYFSPTFYCVLFSIFDENLVEVGYKGLGSSRCALWFLSVVGKYLKKKLYPLMLTHTVVQNLVELNFWEFQFSNYLNHWCKSVERIQNRNKAHASGGLENKILKCRIAQYFSSSTYKFSTMARGQCAVVSSSISSAWLLASRHLAINILL